MASPEARVLIGAAVLDDILGLVILAVVGAVGTAAASGIPLAAAVSPGLVAGQLALAFAFLAGSVLLGRALAPRLFDAVTLLEARGLLVTATLAFILSLAFLADLAGSALIIGGFAAGLVLSRTRQAGEIEHEMRPVTDVFTPVFFVLVGASVDVTRLDPTDGANAPTLLLVAILLVVAIAGKMAAGLGVASKGTSRLIVGLGMVPRGEVGLIFAQAGTRVTCVVGGVAQPLVSGSLHAALTLVVLLTTLVGPPALRWAFDRQEARTP
jgi:Kef-type K+ transport system membrane component KefB